jgi:hypothetical protein
MIVDMYGTATSATNVIIVPARIAVILDTSILSAFGINIKINKLIQFI